MCNNVLIIEDNRGGGMHSRTHLWSIHGRRSRCSYRGRRGFITSNKRLAKCQRKKWRMTSGLKEVVTRIWCRKKFLTIVNQRVKTSPNHKSYLASRKEVKLEILKSA